MFLRTLFRLWNQRVRKDLGLIVPIDSDLWAFFGVSTSYQDAALLCLAYRACDLVLLGCDHGASKESEDLETPTTMLLHNVLVISSSSKNQSLMHCKRCGFVTGTFSIAHRCIARQNSIGSLKSDCCGIVSSIKLDILTASALHSRPHHAARWTLTVLHDWTERSTAYAYIFELR